MSFEIIFITEGPDCTPAAEIQFSGQRLCVIRYLPSGTTEVTFVKDLYADRDVDMTFPLHEFTNTANRAARELKAWLENLAGGAD